MPLLAKLNPGGRLPWLDGPRVGRCASAGDQQLAVSDSRDSADKLNSAMSRAPGRSTAPILLGCMANLRTAGRSGWARRTGRTCLWHQSRRRLRLGLSGLGLRRPTYAGNWYDGGAGLPWWTFGTVAPGAGSSSRTRGAPRRRRAQQSVQLPGYKNAISFVHSNLAAAQGIAEATGIPGDSTGNLRRRGRMGRQRREH